jgi:ADP-ribose pyrophosphatase YjhB (NUDIX family)
MSTPHHVLVFAVRERARRRELLVFRREGTLRVPCGEVSMDESAAEGALRALDEVTGLSEVGAVRALHAELTRVDDAPAILHSYAVESPDERARWQHVVYADRPDHGAVVDLFWAPVDDTLTLADGLGDHLDALRAP